nr:retrovirus-related Pol polyprotein from transposon TNT 1-94 [Tanacetum cinerariifolium]
ITVIPIPTIRIHNAHPISQIIGNLSSTTQTMSMARITRDQGGISQILNEDLHTRMFACFLSQEEPKRVHQAPRAWYETLATYLLENGFHRGQIDQTLFIKKQKRDILLVQIYVDDIIFGKSASTPIDTEKPLLKDPDGEDVDVHIYRSMIGSLMYLTSSRPDIMFADSPFDLVAYSDSDYAGASLDRKSTTGGCQFLGSRLISWQCKKQTVIATSSTKTKYVAGKFHGKVDEGYLVGYSVCSKAFKVFNSRTRIVQETLHVNFMENKPTIAGSGPAWLFDIDSLTRTMNYHPVIAENQTNSNTGFQVIEKAGEEGTQTYVLFLVGAQTRKQGDKTENKDKGKSPIVTITGVGDLNTEFEECNNNSNDVGAEADINNMESIISVSPIPTTRIHKDHPTSQIIGDLSLTTQTRSMARAVRDQGHTQEEGIDYEEVFALVARIEAIKLFLAYASFMGFPMYQMDVKSAFLYGTIEEEVYVCQPPGFEDLENLDKVYKVVKALYGLHQAPRAWYETLATYLLKNGFQRGTIGQTLFIKKQ